MVFLQPRIPLVVTTWRARIYIGSRAQVVRSGTAPLTLHTRAKAAAYREERTQSRNTSHIAQESYLGQRSRLHAFAANPPRPPTTPEHENAPERPLSPTTRGLGEEGAPGQLPSRNIHRASTALQLFRHIPVGRASNSRALFSRARTMSQEQQQDINSRPSAPVRSYTPGPPDGSNDFLKEQISKQQRSNFHSSSLNKSVTMVANSVNRTALHPSGVE